LRSIDQNLDQDLGSPRVSRNVDFDNRSEIHERDKLSNIC